MSVTLQTMYEEMRSTWNDMQHIIDIQEKEVKAVGDASQETKQTLDRMNDRLSGIETAMARPRLGNPLSDRETHAQEAKDAFIAALAKGYGALSPEQKSMVQIASPGEVKVLQQVDETGGGYLAPLDFVQDIIKQIILYSPIRDIATVRQTQNKSILFPTRTATFAASWVSEQASRAETAGLKYGQEEIMSHEMYALVLITYADMEDAYFDMSQQIQMECAEQFAVTEGAAFVNGNGVGKPEGLLTNASVPTVVSGQAAIIAADTIINAAYSLKSAYAKNATWIMNRATLGAIRVLKDTYGQYLWQPGLASDIPNTILDHPYMETPDMPAIAASSYPIMFGDFKRAYVIVDRVSMVMTRLTERYADLGQIGFIARKRVGGQVVLPEAILKYECHT
jgi:HK97 family phage major capsid protein